MGSTRAGEKTITQIYFDNLTDSFTLRSAHDEVTVVDAFKTCRDHWSTWFVRLPRVWKMFASTSDQCPHGDIAVDAQPYFPEPLRDPCLSIIIIQIIRM